MVYLRKNVFGDSYYDVVYESFVTVKLCMGNLKKKKKKIIAGFVWLESTL